MISRRSKDRREGFTLLEIIIALAVFGFVVTGLLAFLPWAIDGKANIKDFNTACAMPDAVQLELERLGFKGVEEATRPDESSGSSSGSAKISDTQPGLYLVARRDGLYVSKAYEVTTDGAINKNEACDIPVSESYFLIKCVQFPEGNDLAHVESNGWLALQVDVQWPYRFGSGNEDDEYNSWKDVVIGGEDEKVVRSNLREHFIYPTAITR